MAPNSRLRAAREARPSLRLPGEALSRAELADAVNAYLWESTGRHYSLDAHTIARYERGVVQWPGAAYRAGIRQILGAATDIELGFAPTHRSTRTGSGSAAAPSGGGHLNPPTEDPILAAIHATTAALRGLDNRFGGGHAYMLVRRYLDDDVMPRVRSGRSDQLKRREHLQAAAELSQLAGWMAYDIRAAAVGRSLMRAALLLADDADDAPLTAEILAGLGHHAALSANSGEAIELGVAAGRIAERIGLRTLRSEAAVLRAHGHALAGDSKRCAAALHEAQLAFTQRDKETVPAWLTYFDEPYLSARTARTLRDSGDSTAAEEFARSSLAMTDGYDRGKLFNTALLSTVLLDMDELDEGLLHGATALEMARGMESARAHEYLNDIAVRLNRFRSQPAADLRNSVREFVTPDRFQDHRALST